MPLSSRRQRRPGIDIWPGFVDALSQLLMVIIFVLLIFTAAQFYLTSALSGSNAAVEKLTHQVADLANLLDLERKTGASLRENLADVTSQLQASIAARDQLQAQVADLGAKSDAQVGQLKDAQDQAALLNQQIAALRDQLTQITAALDASEKKAKDQDVQIVDLGKRLNAALANKVQELAQYRSEFFGRLRQILGDRPDIRIEGDRFVFQSEVLFAPASADLAPEAQQELNLLAGALKEIAAKIPPDIPWVLRIDGHTDKRPINTPQFKSNWELSTARATEVVKYLIQQGIPADHLAAAGFGEFQPIDTGNTDAAFAKNRRIEFKLTER
jgi:chemotaxis protein MotB